MFLHHLGAVDAAITLLMRYALQEHADVNTQMRALGQKYMGVRPQGHRDEMFRDTSIHLGEDMHPVPVSNFLNAQCLLGPFPCLSGSWRN